MKDNKDAKFPMRESYNNILTIPPLVFLFISVPIFLMTQEVANGVKITRSAGAGNLEYYFALFISKFTFENFPLVIVSILFGLVGLLFAIKFLATIILFPKYHSRTVSTSYNQIFGIWFAALFFLSFFFLWNFLE